MPPSPPSTNSSGRTPFELHRPHQLRPTKKRFGAKGSEAFPVNAPPYDARHTRNVCVLRPFILSRSLSFRAVPNTVRVSGWSFLLILSIAKHLSQKPDKQARMKNFFIRRKKRPRRVSFVMIGVLPSTPPAPPAWPPQRRDGAAWCAASVLRSGG